MSTYYSPVWPSCETTTYHHYYLTLCLGPQLTVWCELHIKDALHRFSGQYFSRIHWSFLYWCLCSPIDHLLYSIQLHLLKSFDHLLLELAVSSSPDLCALWCLCVCYPWSGSLLQNDARCCSSPWPLQARPNALHLLPSPARIADEDERQ